MIKFNLVRWMNLLSTGNIFTEVSLDKSRTTLIIGSNGAGKSTILDALTFVLFNKPFRKVVKGLLINSVTNKNLLVEVVFEKGGTTWLVRRGSKPNIFEIYRDGKLVDQNSENRDYQSYLENTVLGMNQKAFTQIVILGAASFVPFMQLTVPVRREVTEEFMDIQVFSDMNTLLKTKVSANRDRISKVSNALDIVNAKIQVTESLEEKRKIGNADLIKAKNDQVSEIALHAEKIIDRMEDERTDLSDFNFLVKDTNALENRKRALENEIIEIEQNLKSRQKIVSFLSTHDNCPTCKQTIDLKFKNEQLENDETQIAFLIHHGKDRKEQIAEIDIILGQQKELQSVISGIKQTIIDFERELSSLQYTVERISNEIAELEKPVIVPDLEALHQQRDVISSQLEGAMEDAKVINAAARLLKDDGIKSVIIKQYIPVLNSLINKYLAQMDFFVDFQINEAFEETIKSRFRDEFSYESFSEGEKMRIDLAILFAWREVAKLRNSAATNLLIFDEVLDSSLDPSGVEEFIRIIKTMTADENIFVISHRGDTIGDKFDDVLKFSRVRGFSHMEVV